ncbi:hypothetical protein SAMN04487761_12251 [Lachnospiraceae bacterium C7]|nr:hypothetical protein SAMN04487761_12251 [Lachnospiraceae bacterium C7]
MNMESTNKKECKKKDFNIWFTTLNFIIYLGLYLGLYLWCNYTIIFNNKKMHGKIEEALNLIKDDLKNPMFFVISIIIIQAICVVILNYLLLRVVIGLCRSNHISRAKSLNVIFLAKFESLLFAIIVSNLFRNSTNFNFDTYNSLTPNSYFKVLL